MKTQIFNTYLEFLRRDDKEVNGVSKEFAEANPDYEKQNKTNKGCWNCSRCSGCLLCSDCSRCSDCSDCSGCLLCSDCSGCSRCSDCSDCSGCSRCSRCSRCSDCSGCSGCSGCSRCSDCSDCSGCSGCSDCSRCSDCSDCSGCLLCSRCSGCRQLGFCRNLKNAQPTEGDANSEPAVPPVPIIENIHRRILAAVSQPGALEMANWHKDGYCGTTHCRAGWVTVLAGEAGKKLEEATSTEHAAKLIYHASCPEIPVAPPRFFEPNLIAMADIQRCAAEEETLKGPMK